MKEQAQVSNFVATYHIELFNGAPSVTKRERLEFKNDMGNDGFKLCWEDVQPKHVLALYRKDTPIK